MKVAVIGGTGPSGLQFIRQGLERGHEILAIVRSPEKIPTDISGDSKLRVVQAGLYDSDVLAGHFTGQDAVVSCLGVRDFKSFWICSLYSETIEPMVTAMRKARVNRFLCLSSGCCKSDPANPFFMEWIVKPLILGAVMRDMVRMEDWLVTNAAGKTGVDYTVVRPPGLTDAAGTETEILAEIDVTFLPTARPNMGRADVARFLLDALETDQFNQKIVAIGLKK